MGRGGDKGLFPIVLKRPFCWVGTIVPIRGSTPCSTRCAFCSSWNPRHPYLFSFLPSPLFFPFALEIHLPSLFRADALEFFNSADELDPIFALGVDLCSFHRKIAFGLLPSKLCLRSTRSPSSLPRSECQFRSTLCAPFSSLLISVACREWVSASLPLECLCGLFCAAWVSLWPFSRRSGLSAAPLDSLYDFFRAA